VVTVVTAAMEVIRVEGAMRPMIYASIVAWTCAIMLSVVMLRATVSPAVRRIFKRTAWVYTAVVILIMLYSIVGAGFGVILPGWFYACLFVGILVPMQIALHVAAIDKEALRYERSRNERSN